MAAVSDAPLIHLCDLRQVAASELDSLLEEEIRVWERELSWDFRLSADLVRRFVQMKSLTGFALRSDAELIGYAYQVCDERKGLIGDFFVRPSRQSPANELMLLGEVVDSLMHTPGVRRIESQLMLLKAPINQPLPFARWATRHDRYFMQISADSIARLPARETTHRIRIQPWNDRLQEEAAHVISAAYRGHVDSEINDQYRNIPGARRFLTNIVRYPGCGHFAPAGSFVAVDEHSGRVCGICLASLVSTQAGHVTQLCVIPGVRGAHIGYELLRTSLTALTNAGCRSASLTVTCANVEAIELYERCGFVTRSVFPALVWEDF